MESVTSAISQARERMKAAGPPESLEGELARRVEIDQAARMALGAIHVLPPKERTAAGKLVTELMAEIDRDNTKWLKQVLPAEGWFRISRYGKQTESNAWLIVQHSPDRALMKQVLARMQRWYPQGEVNGLSYALLYDRVAMLEGRPQRFGSQAACVNGKLDFHPIEDRERADARRRSVGLKTTLADAAKNWSVGRPC